MADFVIVKKKMNVPLLVFLLIFGFVPGIIYLIYCKIPVKVSLVPPKSNGWKLRVIPTAIAFAASLWLMTLGDIIIWIWLVISTGLMLVSSLFGIKNKSRFFIILGLFAAIMTLALAFILYGIYSLASVAAAIISLFGIAKAFKHHDYYVLAKDYIEKEVEAEVVEAEVVAEEKAE